MTKLLKTQSAQKLGEYKPTSLDNLKIEADFRLLQTSPYMIAWKSGERQKVTENKLRKLQANHSWLADF